jgi:uncharacterized DUF497 family protein
MDFRWNDWNEEHISEHGVTPHEAERVVETCRPPFPRVVQDEKRLVWGPGTGGRLLQVIFVLDEDGAIFIIHARPLTEREKHQYRRIRRIMGQ